VTPFFAELLLTLAGCLSFLIGLRRIAQRDYAAQLYIAAAWASAAAVWGLQGSTWWTAGFSAGALLTGGHWFRRHSKWGWR
jgi:hypothetical protein